MAFSTLQYADSVFSLFGMGAFLLLVLTWIILAGAVALKGDDVDKSNRVAHFYGYTVCLVAIIVGLMTSSSLIDAAFDRSNPLQSEYDYGAVLTSFEAYKATYRREDMMLDRGSGTPPDTISETTLQRRYDALVAHRLAAVRYRTAKTFTTSGLLLILALSLFIVHWRWIRRLGSSAQVNGRGDR